MIPIDEQQDASEMDESAVQAEFTKLTNLQNDPGFQAFIGTIKKEFTDTVEKVFSNETAVVDIATFFTREEVLATGKVLRRYLTLVDDRVEELKEEIEKHQRSREQS